MAHIIDGPNKEFASRLIRLRRKKNITQHELAQAIDTDKRSISMYENGRTFPREDTLRRLAKEFNEDLHWLTTGNSEEMQKFYDEQMKKKLEFNKNHNKNFLDLLYIENWNKVGANIKFKKITYNETPQKSSQSSDISKFVPIIVKSRRHNCRATIYPRGSEMIPPYMEDAIIIFDQDYKFLDDIPSGSNVLFRERGKENMPGLRKLLKEPGMNNILVPIMDSHNIPPLVLNDLNVEILGKIITIITNHK